MENSSPVVDWALENSDRLALSVQKVTWVDEWLPGYFDYHVEVSVGGVIHKGRGTDSSEQTAFVKAVAESLERAACYGLDNPWGTAAHTDRGEAEKRAYAELLGMDRALCHHYCRLKGRRVPLEELKSVLPIGPLQKKLKAHGLELALCELRPARDARVFAAYGWSGTGSGSFTGIISGFGTSDMWLAAARQAILECLRKFLAIHLGKAVPPVPMEDLRRDKSPWWHIWTMAGSAAAKLYLMQNILPASIGQSVPAPENISRDCVSIARLESLDTLFKDIPLLIMQARSQKLLVPQFGETIVDARTSARLEDFSGGPVDVDLSVPHFYG